MSVPLGIQSVASPLGAMYLTEADADAMAAEWPAFGDEGEQRAAVWEKYRARSISYEKVREIAEAAVSLDDAKRGYLRVMEGASA